jgi:hypothetical protein
MEQEIPVPACYFPPRLFWWCCSLPMPPLPTTIFVLLYRLMGIALLAFLLLSLLFFYCPFCWRGGRLVKFILRAINPFVS